MAITNNIPQFDLSKTNLGEAPVDGFKANTLVKSEEVNKAIYDCSLSITALIKALNNTYGGFAAGVIDSSKSVDDIANTLSLILGLGVEDATIENSNGEQKVNAYRLKYNGMPLLLDNINGYGFESFLIQRKNFVCATLDTFNKHFINRLIPITAFYLVENGVDMMVKNIDGKEIRFVASGGDIYPMYKSLIKVKDGNQYQYWFNGRIINGNTWVNTILLRGDDNGYIDNNDWESCIIPCPLTGDPVPGHIYIVGMDPSIMDNGKM